VKIQLVGRELPRNGTGDPHFTLLGTGGEDEGKGSPPTLLDIFTEEEITEMVNRYLYSAEYQRTVHRNRAREETKKLAPIKRKVRELFSISWLKATPEQIRKATEAVVGGGSDE